MTASERVKVHQKLPEENKYSSFYQAIICAGDACLRRGAFPNISNSNHPTNKANAI
jgi:hypothetical protein